MRFIFVSCKKRFDQSTVSIFVKKKKNCLPAIAGVRGASIERRRLENNLFAKLLAKQIDENHYRVDNLYPNNYLIGPRIAPRFEFFEPVSNADDESRLRIADFPLSSSDSVAIIYVSFRVSTLNKRFAR